MSAAVASGFVAPAVIARIVGAEGSKMPEELLLYTGLWNQGFAKVWLVATWTGVMLLAVTIVKSGRLPRSAGVLVAVVSALVLLLFFAGHLTLDVHGFSLVTFAQSAWLIWVGVLLCRGGDVPVR